MLQDSITLAEVQELIRRMYGEKDKARGVAGTFMWLMEEVGELSTALRERSGSADTASDELAFEFADVLAWLVTIANISGVDLQAAFLAKYGKGCPGCGRVLCVCPIAEKP